MAINGMARRRKFNFHMLLLFVQKKKKNNIKKNEKVCFSPKYNNNNK